MYVRPDDLQVGIFVIVDSLSFPCETVDAEYHTLYQWEAVHWFQNWGHLPAQVKAIDRPYATLLISAQDGNGNHSTSMQMVDTRMFRFVRCSENTAFSFHHNDEPVIQLETVFGGYIGKHLRRFGIRDMVDLARERLADARYRGQAQDAVGYLLESMVAPSVYVVATWGKKGTSEQTFCP